MAENLKFITVLIFTTVHFSFIFCQFYLEPRTYRSRKSGSGRLHSQRKASDLIDANTNEILRDIKNRVEHPEHKVVKTPQKWQAAVDTHPATRKTQAEKLTVDEIIHENKGYSGRKARNKKMQSSKAEDDHSKSSQTATEKYYLRKGRHAKKSARDKHEEMCNENCFTPKCEVECTGVQSSAACSADQCKALTRGEDSASLCAGENCHALCFKDECISGCEGLVCYVKCHGRRCHAVSEGVESGCMCVDEDCMAYGSGLRTQISCEGDGCHAQCMGEKCTAACNGTDCVAGCTGINCEARCLGKNCQELQHVGEMSDLVDDHSDELKAWTTPREPDLMDDGYYGNRDFLQSQKKIKQDGKPISVSEDGRGPIKTKKRPEDGELEDMHSVTDPKVRLDYSINIDVKPALAEYIRTKILSLKEMGGLTSYMRYIPELAKYL